MLADLYDCSVNTVRQTEGPALGVAILAGVGCCGIYESVEEACDELISEAQSTGADQERGRQIQRNTRNFFKELYGDLKDSYKSLRHYKKRRTPEMGMQIKDISDKAFSAYER